MRKGNGMMEERRVPKRGMLERLWRWLCGETAARKIQPAVISGYKAAVYPRGWGRDAWPEADRGNSGIVLTEAVFERVWKPRMKGGRWV